MIKKIFQASFLCIGFFFVSNAFGQSNIQSYTPSALLKMGQIDASVFNNLYYQNKIFDRDGTAQDAAFKDAFYNGIYVFNYGISNNRRVNIGLEININRVRRSFDKVNPFSAFGGGDDPTKFAITTIGPRIKVSPFSALPRFSFQTALLIPLRDDLEDSPFLAQQATTIWHQFFFDKNIGSKFQLFTEASILARFKDNDNGPQSFFRTPIKVFISYFPSSKFTLYTQVQWAPKFGKKQLKTGELINSSGAKIRDTTTEKFGKISYFTEFGVGAKYQVSTHLNLELSYTKFVAGKNDGAGSTLNFGIRYISN